jgi:hypothetical protein
VTKVEAAQLMAMLVAQWPQSTVSSKTSQLYEAHLLDLDFQAAQVAVSRIAKTTRWLPTVAEIREVTCDVIHGPKRLGGEAWGDVLAEIRRVGAYDVPKFKDPATAECVRLLDWRGLCLGTNEVADRARFVELYEGLQDRARLDVIAGHALPPARGTASLGTGLSSPVSLAQLLADPHGVKGSA